MIYMKILKFKVFPAFLHIAEVVCRGFLECCCIHYCNMTVNTLVILFA